MRFLKTGRWLVVQTSKWHHVFWVLSLPWSIWFVPWRCFLYYSLWLHLSVTFLTTLVGAGVYPPFITLRCPDVCQLLVPLWLQLTTHLGNAWKEWAIAEGSRNDLMGRLCSRASRWVIWSSSLQGIGHISVTKTTLFYMALGWSLPERMSSLECKSLIRVLLELTDSIDSDLCRLRERIWVELPSIKFLLKKNLQNPKFDVFQVI